MVGVCSGNTKANCPDPACEDVAPCLGAIAPRLGVPAPETGATSAGRRVDGFVWAGMDAASHGGSALLAFHGDRNANRELPEVGG